MHELNSFFNLSPELILQAAESLSFRCTGRILQLNSLENRVYEVEVECADPKTRLDNFKVIKFYRPDRWTLEQINQEHQLVQELDKEDIPVCLPHQNSSGEYVSLEASTGIRFCLYPKVAGRLADELDRNSLTTLGRLIARMHLICAKQKVSHKEDLNSTGLLASSIDILENSQNLPDMIRDRFLTVADELSAMLDQRMADVHCQRIHGDLHLGNILWDREKPLFLDFDDVLNGPAVQDIWLIQPGRDPVSVENREILLDAYQEFKHFDYDQLDLIELLRALRIIKFNAWIDVRWDDPSFPLTFPNFKSLEYWREQLNSLEEILSIHQSNEGSFW
jgi:Ser/Thr protein kinase RdoA (MazF antagonist)